MKIIIELKKDIEFTEAMCLLIEIREKTSPDYDDIIKRYYIEPEEKDQD